MNISVLPQDPQEEVVSTNEICPRQTKGRGTRDKDRRQRTKEKGERNKGKGPGVRDKGLPLSREETHVLYRKDDSLEREKGKPCVRIWYLILIWAH